MITPLALPYSALCMPDLWRWPDVQANQCPGQKKYVTPRLRIVVAGDVDDERSLQKRVETSELGPIDDAGRDAAVLMTISMPP